MIVCLPQPPWWYLWYTSSQHSLYQQQHFDLHWRKMIKVRILLNFWNSMTFSDLSECSMTQLFSKHCQTMYYLKYCPTFQCIECMLAFSFYCVYFLLVCCFFQLLIFLPLYLWFFHDFPWFSLQLHDWFSTQTLWCNWTRYTTYERTVYIFQSFSFTWFLLFIEL